MPKNNKINDDDFEMEEEEDAVSPGMKDLHKENKIKTAQGKHLTSGGRGKGVTFNL